MKIQLPLETWMAIHDWIVRRELAAKMEKLWDSQLTPIAQHWLHEHRRNVQIGELRIRKNPDGQAELRDEQNAPLPIATVDMPGNISGFSKIYFGFIDLVMLEFLARMRPIYHNICIKSTYPRLSTALLLERLQPLISCEQVIQMEVAQKLFPLFNDYFPAILINTKILYISEKAERQSDLVVNWLFTPRKDGQPRTLFLNDEYYTLAQDFNDILTTIRQRFGDPERKLASPFFVRVNNVDCEQNIEEVQHLPWESVTENGQTGEQLTIKKVAQDQDDDEDEFHFMITNCALHGDQIENKLREMQVLDWQWRLERKQESIFQL